MALELNTLPTFSERVAAADLAVVGTITGPVGIEDAPGYEKPRIMGFFELQVEEALLGKPSRARSAAPDRRRRVEEAPALVNGRRRRHADAAPSRDVSPGLPENLYTPHFSSAFQVNERGTHSPPGRPARRCKSQGAAPDPRRGHPGPCPNDARRRRTLPGEAAS